MLGIFRRLLRSRVGVIVGLLFLGTVAFAFAAGDLSNIAQGGLGGTDTTVAKADGEELAATDLQNRVQRVFDSNRQDNPGLDMRAFVSEGGFDAVMEQMIDNVALRAFADKHGIVVSKRLIDAEIARNPAFQDATGKFSQ